MSSNAVGSLPKRPKPPAVADIIEDVQVAADDDALFRYMGTVFEENKEDLIAVTASESTSSQESSPALTPVDPNIEETYQKVISLLKVHRSLPNSAQELQKQYRHLQQSGKDLSLSLAELKQKAQSSLPNSLPRPVD